MNSNSMLLCVEALSNLESPKRVFPGFKFGQIRAMSDRLAIILRRFFCSWTSLEARLFPAMELPVNFRPYISQDFEQCMEVYRRNEPDRFPVGHISRFEEYLKSESRALIVAELNSRVVACGGLCLDNNVATLCYGLVHPEFQMQRIGTTLALLRVAQLTPRPGNYYVLIFAVQKSLPFYVPFGFVQAGEWQEPEGNKHPFAFVCVLPSTLRKIRSTLDRRGILMREELKLYPPSNVSCVIDECSGRFKFENRSEEKPNPEKGCVIAN